MEKNLKTNADTKQRQFFTKRDAAVYIIIAAVIVTLFFAFVIIPRKSESNGFCAYAEGKLLFTYYYESDKIVVTEYGKNRTERSGDKIYIYCDEEKSGFNELTVDRENKTVKVTDSDCSKTRDCVYEPSLKRGGAIYCVPHKLKITATGGAESVPPTTG